MSLEQHCLESLAVHVRSEVADCGPPVSGVLPVPGLAMEFHAFEAVAEPFSGGHTVSVVFDARALGSEEHGIRVLAIGLGATIEAAVVDAGHQWAMGVLPVLISFLLDQVRPDVERFPMIVGVKDSGDRYGWTVHLGPVVSRAFGPPGAHEMDRGDLSSTSAFRPLFEAIHPFAAHDQLMWVESFAARFPAGKVDATCRLQNQDWPEGRESLLAWATTWPDRSPCILSKRQFLLFQPTPLEGVDSSASLQEALTREMTKQR